MAASIWNRSPHQQFTLTVGGAPLANSQFAGPWEAFGVIVANNTNQYVYLPDVNFYIPPGVVGATVPIPGLMEATASFTTPPGITALPTIAGQIATLDYFAEELTPYPGVPTNITVINTPAVTISNTPAVTVTSGTVAISNSPAVTVTSGTVSIGNTPAVTVTSGSVAISNTPSVTISSGSVSITAGTVSVQNVGGTQLQTAQSQTLLTTATVAAGATGSIAAQTLPTGTHAVEVVLSAAQSIPDVVSIQGVQTGNYLVRLAGFPAGAVSALVASAADTQVNGAVVNTNGGGPITYWLAAIRDTAAIYPANVYPAGSTLGGGPFYPGLIGALSVEDLTRVQAPTITRNVEASGATHLHLDVSEPQPASFVGFDASLAGAATSVIVAGVALNYIRLFEALIGGPGVASIWLEDTVGTIYGVFIQGGVGTPFNFHRIPLGVALGARVHNTDVVARFVKGTLSYTQSSLAY